MKFFRFLMKSNNVTASIKMNNGRIAHGTITSAAKQSIGSNKVAKGILGGNGVRGLLGESHSRKCIHSYGVNHTNPPLVRSFASRSLKQSGETSSKARKEIYKAEDPFDSPTYNIPEKPVTFTEGASYSVLILAALGVAATAGYAVFTELIFQPKEYKVFSKALKRIQDDGQVRARIGSPITGYGQESRNRAARQRIPHKIHEDENGVQHVEINFFIRGPHGAGKVYASMFNDKVDRQWKYTFLIVEITSPATSRSQMILESYLPS